MSILGVLGVFAAVWLIGALIFFIFIRREADNREVGFAPIQAIVAAIWPLWLLWYCYVLVKEKLA